MKLLIQIIAIITLTALAPPPLSEVLKYKEDWEIVALYKNQLKRQKHPIVRKYVKRAYKAHLMDMAIKINEDVQTLKLVRRSA